MIWQEPPMGAAAPPELWARDTVQQIRHMIDGEVAAPPVHYLTGMRPTAVAPGTCEFRMPATPWLASPSGLPLGGVLAVLADGPLGCAIQTELPPATPYTTAELSMSFLRPAIPDGRELVASGRALHVGRTLALSDVLITGADGRGIAHGTSRCFVFPSLEVPAELPPLPPLEEPTGVPPYRRPPEGHTLDEALWSERSGLEILRGYIDGSIAPPPIHHLTGQRPIAAAEGTCTFSMPASGWLPSPTGLVEGGTLVMLADAALISAVQTTVPAGTAFASVDITYKFLRPVPPDGRELTATAQVTHRGRTMAVASAQITNADGKLVGTAISSTLILEGRAMSAPVAVEDQPAPTD